MQQQFELPPGGMHQKGRMEPGGVVLTTPAVGQIMNLSHRGEQLGVKELVS